jgi:hypothetical protein
VPGSLAFPPRRREPGTFVISEIGYDVNLRRSRRELLNVADVEVCLLSHPREVVLVWDAASPSRALSLTFTSWNFFLTDVKAGLSPSLWRGLAVQVRPRDGELEYLASVPGGDVVLTFTQAAWRAFIGRHGNNWLRPSGILGGAYDLPRLRSPQFPTIS